MKSHTAPSFVANYTHISERWVANHRPCGHLPTSDTCTVRRSTTLCSQTPSALLGSGSSTTSYLPTNDRPYCPAPEALLSTPLMCE